MTDPSHGAAESVQASRPPAALVMMLLSDATFGRGEPSAGEVDVEVEHDRLGLPFVGGKTIHGLLRDSWMAMAAHFPELAGASLRVFGRAADQAESCILRVGDACLDDTTRAWVAHAESRDDNPLSPGDVLRALTDVRNQTAEERTTGAPAQASLRSSRVVLRDLIFDAPLLWLEPPNATEVQCLALTALGVRHAGLGRNRGRGHVLMCLRLHESAGAHDTGPVEFAGDLERTRSLASRSPGSAGSAG